jgi:hypothetical protein
VEVPIKKLDSSGATQEGSTSELGYLRPGPLRIATAVCLLTVGLMAVMAVGVSIWATSRSAHGEASPDFVEYWAAGQLLVHGADPYDAAATLRLERAAGWNTEQAEITYSPPVIFILVAPLGLIGAKAGAVLWFTLLATSLMMSIRLLWILNGRRAGQLHLLCYCFAPALTCLMSGQIGIYLLLGIVLFLYLQERWPVLAGAALVVCFVKPHLFLLFGAVLLVWAVNKRKYSLIAGVVAGLFAACVLTLCFDPHAFSQYAQSIVAAKPTEPMVPTLSRMLRFIVHRDAVWLQFLPAGVGCGWALWYFWKRRERWNWQEQGSLLLLVSVACAPYAWFTDEAVLLPAILAALYRSEETRRSLLPFGLITGTALGELFKGFWITSPYFVWTMLAWLAWYLYATYGGGRIASAEESRIEGWHGA